MNLFHHFFQECSKILGNIVYKIQGAPIRNDFWQIFFENMLSLLTGGIFFLEKNAPLKNPISNDFLKFFSKIHRHDFFSKYFGLIFTKLRKKAKKFPFLEL